MISVRERVLLELARRDKRDAKSTFAAITEAASIVLDVARVSIWELQQIEGSPTSSEADIRLACKDLYLSSEKRHLTFSPIYGRDFPAYIRAIRERRTITADDANTHPSTAEFASFYLKPLGITSMLDVPIWHDSKVYGVLCFEHIGRRRRWQSDEEGFAIDMADIASGCLESAARASAQRQSDTVFESLTEGVLLVNPQGEVVRSNSAAYRLLRDEEHQILSQGYLQTKLDLVDALDRPLQPSDWPFVRALRGEVIRGEIYGVNFKDGSERRYVRVTFSPLIEDGRVTLYALVFDDATEEVIVERLKRDLLSRLAHELKTPLAIVKGYAQQLEATTICSPDVKRTLTTIATSCDRMDHLNETLLDLASIILGRLDLTRERVDFAELARNVVGRLHRFAPRRIAVPKIPEGPLYVDVDSARMAQVIRHLIDNALLFSPEEVPIEIAVDVVADRVTLSVRDHGVGIPEAAQQSLFAPFHKAQSGRDDEEGLGVGLYLSREILRRHGGEVWFDTAEGEGTTFHLSLPLAATK